MKIAVLSDTHNLLRPEVKKVIKSSDAVIHGGDINTQTILNEMKTIMKQDAPLFAVRGNNDGEWAQILPMRLEFELEGVTFFLIHNKGEIPKDVEADVIVFGHSHKYYEQHINGRLWLNPGSCGTRRFNLPVTMAVLNINEGRYFTEKIEIEQGKVK